MKNLILVNGSMGVGKSSTCEALLDRLQPAAYLDGDWCWMIRPWSVNARTIAMVEQNIAFLLNRYLDLPEIENVIFGWVMHRPEIVLKTIEAVQRPDLRVNVFTLVCERAALQERMERDISNGRRTRDNLDRSLERLPLYEAMPWPKLDVTALDPRQAAEWIATQVLA